MKAVYKKIREMMIYKGVRGRAAHIFGVIMLVFLGLVFAMPLYWMISTALTRLIVSQRRRSGFQIRLNGVTLRKSLGEWIWQGI